MMFFDVIGMLVAVGYATPLFLCVLPPLGAVYMFVQVGSLGVRVLQVVFINLMEP